MYAALSICPRPNASRKEIATSLASRRRALSLLLAVFLAALAATVSKAQSSAGCPAHKPLTLKQVVGYIDPKTSEDLALRRIESCHIAFPLNADALDKLSDAGVSERMMNTLFKVDSSQISLDQARAEVPELTQHMQQAAAKIAAERDQALQKLDADYLPQREQASHIDPRGQFEPTADYNRRVQQNQDKLAAMDRKHDADRNQLLASFAKKTDDRQRPYKTKIAALQSSNYPDSRAIAYTTYNPDTRQLQATVDGDEYLFDQVPPQTAETLAKNWPRVKLYQPYEDDTLHKRFLALASIPAPVPGYSIKQKKNEDLNSHLQRARQAVANRDYETAEHEFAEALKIDNSNQEAKAGLDSSLAMLQKRNSFLQELTNNGVWLDPKTPLLWTMKKSEHTMNWHGADDYCQTLRLDGLTGWRLPTALELQGIYDPSVTKTKRSTVPGDSTFAYMRGPIDVTGMVVFIWSGTLLPQGGAAVFWFDMGKMQAASLDRKVDNHALCVRKYQPKTDGLDQPPATASQPIAPPADSHHPNDSAAGHTVPVMDATAKTPADQLERQGETFYVNHQYAQAFPLAKQSCDQGSQDGCALEASMYGLGLGVSRDLKLAGTLATQSCDSGSARGCEVVGSGYYAGLGVPKDRARAAELFTASCKAGFAVACWDIGVQTLLGNGVTKDVPQAVQLLNQSCSGGYQRACDELTSLHKRGID